MMPDLTDNVHAFPTPKPEPLKCPGCGREPDNHKALYFIFNRVVTDAEMRFLHEVMQRAAALMPEDVNAD